MLQKREGERDEDFGGGFIHSYAMNIQNMYRYIYSSVSSEALRGGNSAHLCIHVSSTFNRFQSH